VYEGGGRTAPDAGRASPGSVWGVRDDRDAEELRAKQLARERAERRFAATAPGEEESAQHERRAEKARYLREKLEEQLEAKREEGEDAG
jgi:hypothetical protein